MQRLILLAVLILLSGVAGYSQDTPVDYHNPVVRNAQRLTTEKFLQLLAAGQIDSALKFVSPSYVQSKKNYSNSLMSYHKELQKYVDSTTLSVVIVYPEDKYNTYRCRYYNKSGEYFYIDLYYNVGKPNSLIEKIWKKTEKELAAERVALAKRAKEEEKTGPPPPPPPPAGLKWKPVKKGK